MWKGCLLVLASVTTLVAGQERDPDSITGDVNEPGPMHERLHPLVGDWSQTIEIIAPDGSVLRGTATTRNRLIFGGRFLAIEGDVELMGQTGQGVIYIGYNTLKDVYTFYNMTSVSTDVTFAEGTWDETARRLTFHGTNLDPVSRRTRTFRIEMTLVDRNTIRQENYFQLPGEDEVLGVRAMSSRTQ